MPTIRVSDEMVAHYYRQALADGDIKSMSTASWRICGDCQSPVTVTLEGDGAEMAPAYKPIRVVGKTHHIPPHRARPRPGSSRRPGSRWLRRWVDLEVRCRRCSACLAQRRRQWAARVRTELSGHMAIGARTWFGTLTLSPEQQFLALVSARKQYTDSGKDLDKDLSDDQQFIARHRTISRWLTLYLKRVRKQAGVPFRYLLVCEKHKSGLPHYHILIHEDSISRQIPKRILGEQWIHGFSRWKLVDDMRQGTYLCKYLAKSPEARVRASGQYGRVSGPTTSGHSEA